METGADPPKGRWSDLETLTLIVMSICYRKLAYQWTPIIFIASTTYFVISSATKSFYRMFPSVSRSSAKFRLNSSISVFNICNAVKYFIITRGSALLVNNFYLKFDPSRKTAVDVILRQRKIDYLFSVTW